MENNISSFIGGNIIKSYMVIIKHYNRTIDEWLAHFNNERTNQRKMCCGLTPMETLLDGKRI